MTMIERALTVEKLREQLTDEGIVFTEETLNTLAEEVIRDYDNDDARAACWEAAMNEAVERARLVEDKAWKTYRVNDAALKDGACNESSNASID